MPSFRYTAMTAAGTLISGEMEETSAKAVVARLQDAGHFPLSAVSATNSRWWADLGRSLGRSRQAAQRDLGIIAQELAALLHAGLALDRAFEVLTGLSTLRRMRLQLSDVLGRIRDGATLADAFAASGEAFPRLFISMVRAGELGGNLEETLHRLSEYLSKAHAIRQAVASAMVYPAILLITAGMAISTILVFVLPEFEPLFVGAGVALPPSTQFIIDAGNFVGAYWWLLLVGAAALAVAARWALARPELRLRCDRLVLRLPILGSLALKIETERFARTLGALLANGVPLPAALSMTRQTLGNAAVAGAVATTATSLREGESLAGLLADTGIFPGFTVDLVRVGEETAQLETVLLRQADIYDREIRHAIDRLLALLVPMITIGLGLVVAGLIASMLTAILSVNDLAAR